MRRDQLRCLKAEPRLPANNKRRHHGSVRQLIYRCCFASTGVCHSDTPASHDIVPSSKGSSAHFLRCE